MNQKRIFEAFGKLGDYLLQHDERLEAHIHRASTENLWFTKDNIYLAIDEIAKRYFSPHALQMWVARYQQKGFPENPKTVGLIMAGNIPLVGMHDILCVLVSGHRAQIKLSERDRYLLPFLIKKLNEIDSGVANRLTIVDRLKNFDAVIATGSNNSAMYFKSYFGKYPHVIRKNRNGIAVLQGDETSEDFDGLARDIFQYFGLGCRSVAKLYVKQGYNFTPLINAIQRYHKLADHPKYRNNLDYNAAVYILDKIPHMSLPNLMLIECKDLVSRIGVLHYEYYNDIQLLEQHIQDISDQVQCVVSGSQLEKLPVIPFGATQQPALSDYADGVDTIEFLLTL